MSLDVDIEARRGKFTLDAAFQSEARALALFGRSGAGKSTLADVIAGLTKPRRGRVVFDGETLYEQRRTNLPAWKRRIGVVFQDPRLFPHLSVRQNLLFGNEAADIGEIANLLGIDTLLERRPRSLSGGEARRVAIGRALAAKPRLLILDEPLAGLDGARRAELLPYLERLKREGGPPLVYVSHSVDEVTRLADEIVLLAHGMTLACAPVSEIFDHPEAEAAAALDAPISVVEAKVSGHDADGTHLTLGDQGFVVPRVDAQPGDRARLVVDARDVAIALSNPRDLSVQNRLVMRVAALKPRAEGVVVRLEAPDLVLKSLVTPAAVAQLGLEPGRTVVALVKATAAGRSH
ncbi:MAG TPA: molybdenum ABC transporter ATP-binding protein [Caulobacteraceae bacterium]|jgi:molybdate transport system ATP-binding protein|nr:molybdenum ABC transporter ATP-binding protein [Caulobacteraceae bacterium]